MTDVSHANRRIHTRHKSHIPARLAHAANSVEGRVENVGEGGVFFATEDLELAVEEGSEVTVSFACRRDGVDASIERAGTVLRTERYFDGAAVFRAFAIKFDDLISLAGVTIG
jgi:hypothetical protein